MFDSLADRIKQDEAQSVNKTQRITLYAVVAVVTLLFFAGLYFAVRALG